MSALSTPRIVAYGALATPLAMLMLPVYVHVPKFYAEQFGLALGTQGALLLGARAFDAVQDPLLGQLIDRCRARGIDGRVWMLLGAPLLALASGGLFAPPPSAEAHIAAWFFAMLMLVYGALALVQISYHAYGAELSRHVAERTRITAVREGLGLLGVLAGVALPAYCAAQDGVRAGYAAFAVIVAGLLLIATMITVRFAPPPGCGDALPSAGESAWRAMMRPFANARFRPLLAVFLMNGTANAVPATLVLFYIDGVIGRSDLAPAFLATYFLAGACAMPLWPWLARRIGLYRAWRIGMLAAMAALLAAAFLTDGDVRPYFIVCLTSGLALGADLALPPALLAETIDAEVTQGRGYPGGAYFGLWTLVTKLNLALAAGIALPLLAALGYHTQTAPSHSATHALALLYALLPCLLKAAACGILTRAMPNTLRTARAQPSWP